jgi:hypothetical protein
METKETNQAITPYKTQLACKSFTRLHAKLLKAGEKPKGKDVSALRNLLVENPEVLPKGWTIHETIRDEMIKAATKDGANKALLLAEVDRWLLELGYATAPALERIHMDTIVTCRLRLVFLEFRQNASIEGGKIPVIEHHDKLLSSAQHRLNKAVESLARVRRLATQAPIFQVNLATSGGQQVNMI